ncbi:MAG: TRAP transporter substrate-binding protein [Rhodospirillaceae bacterium]|nr:TRAP transporter substrate-binding protein [Rhodospirillaceae bacterium]
MKHAFWCAALIWLLPVVCYAQTTPLIAASSAAPGSTIKDHFLAFERTLQETFEGDITITLLVDGEAGSEETSLAGLRRGRVHFSAVSVAAAATAVPELSVLVMPYLFDSDQEADFVLDNFIFEPFQTLFTKKGLTLIRWLDSGWAAIYGRKPIVLPKDLAGYRMRAASALTAQAFLESLNADVIPLTFADIIPALQTGLIDGGATSPFMFLTGGLYEHASELTLTRHALNPGTIIANSRWFDSLTPENQSAVKEAYAPSSVLREGTRRQTCESYGILRERGITIRTLTAEQESVWKAAVMPSHQSMVARIGGQADMIYSAIQDGKAAFKALGLLAIPPCE